MSAPVTIEQIREEISSIREAISSGALEIETRAGGTTSRTKFASFSDLKNRLDWLEGQEAAVCNRTRRRGVLAAF